MASFNSYLLRFAALFLISALLNPASAGFRRKKYEQPITKDTQQPDKVLFDRAITDIEHGRFEVARLTLNTLINTYDSSEYLAKAKLAIADSWYREGGSHGLAQAEAEYKDFELFYPQMEEAAESQWRVCQIHYKQMDKADRDNSQAQRAEDECRQLLVQYPNSKYLDRAKQMLRNTQEVLGEKEYRTGAFYFSKGSSPASANRFQYLSEQYPLYSGADEALWQEAEAFKRMGDRFEERQATALTRLVREYPLSSHLDEAKEQLTAMKHPVPPADPGAYARMKYELENRTTDSLFTRSLSMFTRGPSTTAAAKMGDPAMATVRPPTPVSVPNTAGLGETVANGGGGITDVSASQASQSELDSKPEARQNVASPAAGSPNAGQTAAPGDQTPAKTAQDAVNNQPFATNHPVELTKKQRKKQKKAQSAAKPVAASTATTPDKTTGSQQ
jgi:outer membrane protein assembly factor BamD